MSHVIKDNGAIKRTYCSHKDCSLSAHEGLLYASLFIGMNVKPFITEMSMFDSEAQKQSFFI